jgi:hypothetical protein
MARAAWPGYVPVIPVSGVKTSRRGPLVNGFFP